MATVLSEGSINADNTEQTIAQTTTNGALVLWLNFANMASGDTYVIRCYTKVRATDSLTAAAGNLAMETEFVDAQTVKRRPVLPISCAYGANYTIQRTAGVNRAFGFRLDSL